MLFVGLMTGPTWRRAAAVLVCLGLWLVFRHWPNPANLARYAPWFALGIASFLLWRRDWRDSPALNGWTVTLATLAVFAIADMSTGLWVFVLGWLLIRRDPGQGEGSAGLAGRCNGWVRFSYALYLLHMIPLYLGMSAINGLGLERGLYLALITFAGALALSWACTVWVERPFALCPGRLPVTRFVRHCPRQAVDLSSLCCGAVSTRPCTK